MRRRPSRSLAQRQRLATLLVLALTVSRAPVAVLGVVSFYGGAPHFLLPVMFSYILASDLLDGFLARRFGICTQAGFLLDFAVDRLATYLQVCVLVEQGLFVLWFLPYLMRDLVSVLALTYLPQDRAPGSKIVSLAALLGIYLSVLVLHLGRELDPLMILVLVALQMASLLDLLSRLYRLRAQLLATMRRDIPWL